MPTCPHCRVVYSAETLMCPADGTSLRASDPDLATDALGDTLESPSRKPESPSGPDALIGVTLAERYRITRRIGEGGMGVVYAADHVVIGKVFAVKVLREKYAERPELAARLRNEAQLASSIQHAHIIDVIDFGAIPDGRTFVVMEFLEGEPLSARVHSGPLPEPKVIDLALQIASALGAAHAKGIVHRDVKPENLFIIQRSGADFVKVVDFGISRALKLDESGNPVALRLTQTGMVLGTPLYMSPEQARGDDDLDERVDVYALGVILYECLTGDVPFRGANYLGIIAQVIANPPVPPRELRPELRISIAIERVVLKALAKKREDRYQSMAEMAADLERVRDGKPALAPALVSRSPSSGAMRVAAIVGSVLLAGTAIGAVGWTAARRARGVAGPTPSPPAPAIIAPVRAVPPPPAPPSPTVVLKFNITPAGAEIFDGANKLGVAPTSIDFARSTEKRQLRFHLDGYDDKTYPVAPQIDGEQINVTLEPSKKPHVHHHASAQRDDKVAPVEGSGRIHETTPDPYGKQH